MELIDQVVEKSRAQGAALRCAVLEISSVRESSLVSEEGLPVC